MLAARSLSVNRAIKDVDEQGIWVEITVNFDDCHQAAVTGADLWWAACLLDEKSLYSSFRRGMDEDRIAKYTALKLGRRVFTEGLISIKVLVVGKPVSGEFVLQRESIALEKVEETSGTTA